MILPVSRTVTYGSISDACVALDIFSMLLVHGILFTSFIGGGEGMPLEKPCKNGTAVPGIVYGITFIYSSRNRT